ncbi:growth regulator [Synechococcus sp. PCC 7502]|uniref:AbrB/MazE/SpoVT family DNA-binding domain-containing protein n=1 Tax=Synechococcus sp. PCC 7502 TaxID=1173263 RepID=UPI00029FFBC5|nr:AbrB/MazE/SpoVT family DNA-binding domain-containing protein [Synechococcus sp. PCC 7502]AFY74388.1 growth regulator [Synechococcus sp. PCC 7502]
MYKTNLRKVGGSIMLAVPPSLLDMLQLQAGSTVGITVDDGKVIVTPQLKPAYSLDELLEQCDPNAPITNEDQEWFDLRPIGLEL